MRTNRIDTLRVGAGFSSVMMKDGHIRNAWRAHGPARCAWCVRPLGSNLLAGGLVMNQSEFEADL